MKKVIFAGNVGCGKTTLSQAIMGEPMEYLKTQTIQIIGDSILDTPGEYLERGPMRGALMVSAADADIIAFLQSAIEEKNMFPPAYAGAFAKEVIGIVTKIEIANEKGITSAESKLRAAGAEKIFYVSSYTGEGIKELKEYLSVKEKQ